MSPVVHVLYSLRTTCRNVTKKPLCPIMHCDLAAKRRALFSKYAVWFQGSVYRIMTHSLQVMDRTKGITSIQRAEVQVFSGAFFSLSAMRAGPVVWDLNRPLPSSSFSCNVSKQWTNTSFTCEGLPANGIRRRMEKKKKKSIIHTRLRNSSRAISFDSPLMPSILHPISPSRHSPSSSRSAPRPRPAARVAARSAAGSASRRCPSRARTWRPWAARGGCGRRSHGRCSRRGPAQQQGREEDKLGGWRLGRELQGVKRRRDLPLHRPASIHVHARTSQHSWLLA